MVGIAPRLNNQSSLIIYMFKINRGAVCRAICCYASAILAASKLLTGLRYGGNVRLVYKPPLSGIDTLSHAYQTLTHTA